MNAGAVDATTVAVTSPNRKGTSVAIWAPNAAAIDFHAGVSRGMYRAQSPRKAPKLTGFDITISAAPTNDGQYSALVAASAPGPKMPAYPASNVPPKATMPSRNSKV